MGRGDVTTHGFRSTFRGWVGDASNDPRELVGQAAHTIRDKAGANDGTVSEVPLPVHGSIGDLATDVDTPGTIVALSSWTTPLAHRRFDQSSRPTCRRVGG